jgi:hypothetical protein
MQSRTFASTSGAGTRVRAAQELGDRSTPDGLGEEGREGCANAQSTDDEAGIVNAVAKPPKSAIHAPAARTPRNWSRLTAAGCFSD